MANYVEEFTSLIGWKTDTKGLKEFDRQVNKVGDLAKRAAMFIGGMFTAQFLANQAQAIDQMTKFADSVNTATEDLIAQSHAMNEGGVATREYMLGLQRLNRRASEVARTGKGQLAPVFEQLNINAKEFAQLGADEQMLAFVEAANQLPEEQRLSVFFAGFDQSGRGIMKATKNLEAFNEAANFAREAGITMTADQAANIESMNDAIGRAQGVFKALANIILLRVAPIVDIAAREFADLWIAAKPFFERDLQSFLNVITYVFKGIQTLLKPVNDLLNSANEEFGGLERWIRLIGIAVGAVFGAKIVSYIRTAIIAAGGLLGIMGRLWGVLKRFAALLLIEDLITYFQGGRSIIGDYIGDWETLIGLFESAGGGIQGFGVVFIQVLINMGNAVNRFVDSMIEKMGIDMPNPFEAIGGFLGRLIFDVEDTIKRMNNAFQSGLTLEGFEIFFNQITSWFWGLGDTVNSVVDYIVQQINRITDFEIKNPFSEFGEFIGGAVFDATTYKPAQVYGGYVQGVRQAESQQNSSIPFYAAAAQLPAAMATSTVNNSSVRQGDKVTQVTYHDNSTVKVEGVDPDAIAQRIQQDRERRLNQAVMAEETGRQ